MKKLTLTFLMTLLAVCSLETYVKNDPNFGRLGVIFNYRKL